MAKNNYRNNKHRISDIRNKKSRFVDKYINNSSSFTKRREKIPIYKKKVVSNHWCFEQDFSYIRLRLISFLSKVAVILLFFTMVVAGVLLYFFINYFIVIALFCLVVIFLSILFLVKPQLILKNVEWEHQGHIRMVGEKITLTLNNKVHDIDLNNIKKYQCYGGMNKRSGVKHFDIIIETKNSQKIHLYQTNRFGDDMGNLEKIGQAILFRLRDEFREVDKYAWLYSKKLFYITHFLTAFLAFCVLAIAVYFQIANILFIFILFVLSIIIPHFILLMIKNQDSLNSSIMYINQDE